MKIRVDKNDIILAIKRYIVDLARRKKEGNRYTKFDSENDVFLGVLGELVFKRMLKLKGFVENVDMEHISELKSNGDYVKNVNGFSYDLFDFKLDLLFDDLGNKLDSFNIDVKTQKYVGSYNDEWQFAVNGKTVDKIESNTTPITHFVFIFSKYGLSDCIDLDLEKMNIDELKGVYKNIENLLKMDEFDLEPIGIISSKRFLAVSESFEDGESFRVNFSNNGRVNNFKTTSKMSRISIKYLDKIDKIIPSRIQDFDLNGVNSYKKMFPREGVYVKISNNNNNSVLMPYNKVYLNSQYRSMEELLLNIKKLNVSRKNKPK